MELRSPDPSSNPYLVLAVCLAAGLDGIRNRILPPESVDQNIFQMTEQEKEELGIEALPDNLLDAVKRMEKSPFIRQVLGEHIFQNYCLAKHKEWEEYSRYVSNWELDQYLYRI